MSEAESRTKITDWYLDEEDKAFILAKKVRNKYEPFRGAKNFCSTQRLKK